MNEQNFQPQNTEREPMVPLQEKKDGDKSLWYWLILLLVLGLLLWYGFTAGWFSSLFGGKQDVKQGEGQKTEQQEQEKFQDTRPQASINNITVQTGEGFPVTKTLFVKGNLEDGCTYLNDYQILRDGNTFYVNLTTRREGDVCTDALVPYEKEIALPLNGLPAGTYTVIINGKQITFELEQDNKIDFSAGAEK